MRFTIYILVVQLIFIVSSCDPPNRTSNGTLFNVADKNRVLPDLEIKSFDGKFIKLKERVLSNNSIKLVGFWATWCGPCNLEYNAMTKVYDKWKEKYNFEVIAISIDKEKMFNTLPAYVDHKQWPFEFYYDEEEKVSKALEINNIPYSFLIDSKGKIVHIDQAYHESYLIELEAMLKQLQTKKD